MNTAFAAPEAVLEEVDQVKSNVLQYMQTWQIEDGSTRQLHLREVAVESFTYKDPTSSGLAIDNISDVSQWIGGFQTQMKKIGLWPISARLTSNIDVHGNDELGVLRFNWEITALSGSVVIAKGVDFGTTKGNKLTSITGFFGELQLLCDAPLWQPKQVYLAGEKITHKGAIYQARWWLNTEPSNTNEAWLLLGMCSEHP